MTTLAALAGCAGQPARDPHVPPTGRAQSLGLRVSLADSAKSVCVYDEGCGGSPKGALLLQPLAPTMRQALSEGLAAAGFELVGLDTERDLVAEVEWHGTDTIALRLRDPHGRVVDQTRFRRSLDHCRDLPELTWDSCWAANFEQMKAALTRPLQSSAAVQALARRAQGVSGSDSDGSSTFAHAPKQVGKLPPAAASPSELPGSGASPTDAEQLHAVQIQETVARYREELQRKCWQPALEAREPGAASAARVGTTVFISAAGAVERVLSTGDPLGYPRLASCIVSHVQHWRFPAARGASSTNIPFIFTSD